MPLSFTSLLLATMSMTEALNKGLDDAFKEGVHHLDSVTYSNVDNHGGLSLDFNFDGNHTYTCTRKLTNPLYVESRHFTIEDFPVIFEVVGRISSTKPIHNSQHGIVDIYTFWIESQPTRLSRALWRRIPEALQAIATRTDFPIDISQVYEEDQATGKVGLKIQWASNEPSFLFNASVDVHASMSITKLSDPAVSQRRENSRLSKWHSGTLGVAVRSGTCACAGVVQPHAWI